MSKITTLYDQFVSRLVSLLPQHKKLSDPYLFEKNTDSEKRQGFGIRTGPGNNPQLQVSCNIILDQEITLVLTRLTKAHETERDKKAATEKALLEDLFLVIRDVEAQPSLGIPATVIGGAYQSHGGIEFVQAERDDYLKIEATFTFRYVEDFN